MTRPIEVCKLLFKLVNNYDNVRSQREALYNEKLQCLQIVNKPGVTTMFGELMTGNHSKHERTKHFLEEACALIELSNLLESYKLGHTKPRDPFKCISKDNACKIQRRAIAAGRGNATEDGVATLKLETRRRTSRRNTPTLNDIIIAHSSGKSIDSKTYIRNLKRMSKYKQKDVNREKNINIQKKHRSTTNRNDGRKTAERKIRKQDLASNLDITNYMLLYPLVKCLRLDNTCKDPVNPLPKTNISKCSLKTWKSFSSFSDTHLLNKNSIQRETYKLLGKPFGVNEMEPRKTDVRKPSLRLSLNLRVKPDSNTVNLLIKSRNGSCETDKNDLNTLSLRLPLQFPSYASDKLHSENLNPSNAEQPASRISNDQKLQIQKQLNSNAPYGKTQAVFNMYGVEPVQQPHKGEVKGFKSNLYFNINIGRQPKSEPRYMHSDSASMLNSQPSVRSGRQVRYRSRVNSNSGVTSLQQSFTLDRRNRPSSEDYMESDDYSQVCRCRPNVSSPCSVSPTCSVSPPCSDTQQSRSICGPCCQDGHPQSARLEEETPLPEDLVERYALLYHRTKQRILGRVGLSAEDARSMVFSPRVFMKKLYEKYKSISNKIEAQQKSVGSCTCSPFIETEQVTVQEENVDPECSLLKRCFGQLIFSNKCVVCSRNKRCGTDYQELKPYECAPDECVEKKSLFACFKKLCKRKEVDKKAKDKKKKKKKKELERKKRRKEKEKKLKKRGTSFLTSIFKKPDEDDDRQRLLNDEGKKRRRGDDEKKGKEGGKSELEEKARKTFAIGRRGYRRITRRIRERYYRNKKLAEEQKGRYACDFYLMSLRNKPCLWVYYLCPFFYPYCLQFMNVWKQVSDLLLFFVAIVVWSPCILFAELLKVLACNMCVT